MRRNGLFCESFNKLCVEQGFAFGGKERKKIPRLWITLLALLLKGRIKKGSFGSFTGQMKFKVLRV